MSASPLTNLQLAELFAVAAATEKDLDVELLAHVKMAGGRISIGAMAPDELVAWTRSKPH